MCILVWIYGKPQFLHTTANLTFISLGISFRRWIISVVWIVTVTIPPSSASHSLFTTLPSTPLMQPPFSNKGVKLKHMQMSSQPAGITAVMWSIKVRGYRGEGDSDGGKEKKGKERRGRGVRGCLSGRIASWGGGYLPAPPALFSRPRLQLVRDPKTEA